MSQIKAEIRLRTNVKLNFHKNVGLQWCQWIPDFYYIRFWANLFNGKKIMWPQILCYKNQGIHWYHWNPTFLWKINFTLVRVHLLRQILSDSKWELMWVAFGHKKLEKCHSFEIESKFRYRQVSEVYLM